MRSISLKDQDLVSIDDSSKVLLVKIKEVDSTSNMYSICRNEGFDNLKIHHVGGLWIWILFPSTNSRTAFQHNECVKSLVQAFKTVTHSFTVDERLVWIEISGLPLCAWGSATFKKVASMFGNFLFFENEQSTSICTEIGTWSINIMDDNIESQNTENANEELKDDNSEDVKSDDEINDIFNELNENKGHNDDIPDNISDPNKEQRDDQNMEQNTCFQQTSKESSSNEFSRPPGFENFKKETSSNCSTSFARFRKKDAKGFSLINEMTRIIEVGDSLGYDVRGCRKSLKKMIDGIQESKMTKLELFRLKSMWGNYAFDYACSMARGRSGGLISMWDPNIFVKSDIWCDDSFVIVKGQWKILVGDYFMINIYGPQDSTEKDLL
ncbi:hypothetical protein Tco_1412547 [Tanacetum coccineum]